MSKRALQQEAEAWREAARVYDEVNESGNYLREHSHFAQLPREVWQRMADRQLEFVGESPAPPLKHEDGGARVIACLWLALDCDAENQRATTPKKRSSRSSEGTR